MQLTLPVCPIQSNGGAGHDTNFPLRILMPLVNLVLNVANNGDCDGKKSRVEMYMCGALIEMGLWKVTMK